MDTEILELLNVGVSQPWLGSFALFLSSGWIPLLVALVLAPLLLRRRRVAAILSILLATAVADSTTSRIVKPFVGRSRPCQVRSDLQLPGGCGPGKSFPSGHAANAFAVAVAGGDTVRFGLPVLLAIATLVALSRVVLGVHYPSDILAGALLGGFVGLIAALGRRRWERRGVDVEGA